jgi:hypothetical protein
MEGTSRVLPLETEKVGPRAVLSDHTKPKRMRNGSHMGRVTGGRGAARGPTGVDANCASRRPSRSVLVCAVV